jgi:hypothetical protein
MNVETLRSIIENPATTPSDQQAAITALRTMAKGGASGLECEAAREALAQIGGQQEPALVTDGLEAELLRATGASSLADVPLDGLHWFCREHGWTFDVERLYRASIRAGAIQSWQRYLDEGDDDPQFTKASFACYDETPSREAATRIIDELSHPTAESARYADE